MAILPIYLDGTEPLRKKAKPVKELDLNTIALIKDMFDTMHAADGIGLAANQVGVLKRIIVVDISGLEETKDIKPFALINPEVIKESGKCAMEEGCLSIPSVRAEVVRPERITVKYRDTNFKEQQLIAEGILARVILHEIDHLNGVLFTDYVPKSKLKEYKDTLEKIKSGEIETRYPVVTNQKVVL
ncbi:MAG: Peptide deformylase [Ignavibacteriae bacterium]|nr:MAG: Peptide deformylase [Ignavibacteriota bacterium]